VDGDSDFGLFRQTETDGGRRVERIGVVRIELDFGRCLGQFGILGLLGLVGLLRVFRIIWIVGVIGIVRRALDYETLQSVDAVDLKAVERREVGLRLAKSHHHRYARAIELRLGILVPNSVEQAVPFDQAILLGDLRVIAPDRKAYGFSIPHYGADAKPILREHGQLTAFRNRSAVDGYRD